MSDSESLLGDNTQDTTTSAVETTTEAVQDTQAESVSTESVEGTTQTEVTNNETSIDTSTESIEQTQETIMKDYDLSRLIEADILEQSNLKDFKSVNDLAKSYLHSQKLVGNSLRLPDENTSDEAKESFYKKLSEVEGVILEPKTPEQKMELMNRLGRPENVDGYTTDDIIPSELLADESTAAELDLFRKHAHEAGLTKEQAQAMMKMRMDQIANYETQMVESRKQGLSQLQELWGNELGQNIEVAKSTRDHLSESFPDQMKELIAVAGNNAALAYMMSELGKSYQEKLAVSNTRVSFGMSPSQANEKIEKLFKDPKFTDAYRNPQHAGHDQAMAEFEKLAAIRSGNIG